VGLEVGIVGLPNAGKTTLFNALTRAGAEITAYASVSAKANVGMAPIADERLERLAALVEARKTTPAAIRVVDVPGTGAALLGNLRQVDALLAVCDGYSPDADPEGDLETLRLELLVADRDHVEKRLRVARQAKSGEPELRAEVAALERLLAHLDAGRPLAEAGDELPPALEPLTTKPLLAIVNGPDGIDAKLEAELAELDPEEAAAFRDGRPSALDEVVRRLFEALHLISFFTVGEKETRAWTLRRGQTALAAAAAIHTDIARGFIRCEVIRWSDLLACGSRAEAQRRGLLRLEGKAYVVEDGDVLNVRFGL
jgi:ribosome-binding ATPase YchF (GTP1/OBG family)